jgi:hypothetical protein
MGYLNDLWKEVRATASLNEELRKRIDGNKVAQFLRRRGYRYVYLGTGCEQTRVDTADLRLDDAPRAAPGSFERQALSLTALTASAHVRLAEFRRHRDYVESGFTRLAGAAALPYPKFVFAHFGVPHPPFVFGPEGEAVDPEGRFTDEDGSHLMRQLSEEQYRRGYVAQVRYTNTRVLAVIDRIVRESRRPPIILLQGDHGSRMKVDWENAEKTDFGEPYSILNAYLVPPAARARLHERISPVNSFRVLLSSLFDAGLPLLPDRSYFSVSQTPTVFEDVTDRVAR